MIPVNPTSVKYPPEMLKRAKRDAALLGYTFGKFVRECMTVVDQMADDDTQKPPMIRLLQVVRAQDKQALSPPQGRDNVSEGERQAKDQTGGDV